MASKASQVEHLKSVPMFSDLSKKELQLVARGSDELVVPAGSVLVDQGQTGHEAFLLLEGEVVVKRNNRKIASLGPGEIIGELSLIDHGPRTATVICETECTVLVVSQRYFLGILEASPKLNHKLLVALARRIRELDRQILD